MTSIMLLLSERRQIKMGGEDAVELDMHATYWSILAGAMRGGDEKAMLIRLLQSRQFYDFLSDASGQKYSDSKTLKKEVHSPSILAGMDR